MDANVAEFLVKNQITIQDWEKSQCEWNTLVKICDDYVSKIEDFSRVAEFQAGVLQKYSKVHSVRWRVKSPDSLLAKIVRKAAKADKSDDKYVGISEGNYLERVTDLIGVRALHLFKSDYAEIHEAICAGWQFKESIIAFVRDGDRGNIKEEYQAKGMTVQNHPAGYRSIHYVVESQPKKSKIISEFQLRTIFEEGWSEIDHRIRYPNLSDDQLLGFFLDIFNRTSASADEMGSFAHELSLKLVSVERKRIEIESERDSALSNLTDTVDELQRSEAKNAQVGDIVKKLRLEIEILRVNSERRSNLTLGSIGKSDHHNFLSSLNRTVIGAESAVNYLNRVDGRQPIENFGSAENALAALAKVASTEKK